MITTLRIIKPNLIREVLLNLYPDNTIKMSDLAIKVRAKSYNNYPLEVGLAKAYSRICVDFKEGLCWRKWGNKEDRQLVKYDTDEGWVHIGWMKKEEIY